MKKKSSPTIGLRSKDRISFACCGDSITVGNFSTSLGGWRMGFFNSMRNHLGYDPKFSGSDSANSFIFNLIGASGETSTGLLSRVTTQSPLFPNTTIALINIGINDVLGAVPNSTITANTISIINQLRTDSPSITIWVANLIDRNTYTAQVNSYNTDLFTALQGIASYSASNVVGKTMHINMNAVVGPYSGTNYADNTHPNATGYALMTNGWYNQVSTIF